MKMHRIGVVALAAALGACGGSKALSDVQLTSLLRMERAPANDPKAPLDSLAIDCLRAWSGDVELNSSLPPSVTGDANKKFCRQRIDGWLADATRNPDKVTFEQASTTASIRRAQALMLEHRGNAVPRMPMAGDQPPKELVAPPDTKGPVDMTQALKGLAELESLCGKAKEAAASGSTTEALMRFSTFCDKRNQQLRQRIAGIQQRGDARQAQMMDDNIARSLEVARGMLADAQGAKKP
ncbi:MAG TPA: hypothetical protein VKB52_03665 [Rhodanobacteraceae bacterium]|nr:hypothetical protein [Rhodanobacteraceae bacterium]